MLILNGIVIAGLLWRPRRNRLSFFVLHLAFTGLFYLLPDAVTRSTKEWFAGDIVCVMYQYISHVMPYVSSFMLVVISLDRLYVILQPLRSSRRGKRYRYALVGMAWIMALLLAIPQPIYAVLIKYEGKQHCDLQYETQETTKALVVIFVCGVIFVPAIIICLCYSLIVYTIWVRMNKGMQIVPTRDRNSTESDQLENKSRSDIMTRAKIKSIVMTFVIVMVFILCWSPFSVNVLLAVYGVVKPGPHYFILMALAPLNSAANPVVFMAFNWKNLQRKYKPPTNGTSTTTSSYFSKNILMRRIPKDESTP